MNQPPLLAIRLILLQTAGYLGVAWSGYLQVYKRAKMSPISGSHFVVLACKSWNPFEIIFLLHAGLGEAVGQLYRGFGCGCVVLITPLLSLHDGYERIILQGIML